MEILYLLIPLSIVLLLAAVAAFVWAVKNHQFEDLEGPAFRVIMDDDNDPLIPPPPGRRAKSGNQHKAANVHDGPHHPGK